MFAIKDQVKLALRAIGFDAASNPVTDCLSTEEDMRALIHEAADMVQGDDLIELKQVAAILASD
jgi:hypothetical protein